MKITIHRGTHEIGGSCVEVSNDSGEGRIVLDLGMPLVMSDRSPFEWRDYERLSIDELLASGVLPPVSGFYAHERPTVNAVFISHAHQDHYGLLRFVHPDIPVYCSTGSRALIEVSNIFLGTAVNMEQLNEIEMWKPTAIAGFRVTPYLVDHSAPDAVAYVVETDQKKLFYSGDFRGHGRKSVLFQRMVSNPVQDVDCLLLEGTMLGRKEGDYPTEADVEEGFKKIIESSDSYTFILSSSQNLDRLVSAYRAAIRSDAMFVIDLYTAFVLDRLKVISANIPQADWPNVRVLYTHYHAEKLAQVDRKHLYRFVGSKINQDEMRSHSGRSVVFYRDNRYFRQMLGNLGDLTGARTVYSMWPGYLEGSGLEEALLSHRMDLSIVHTSGHAVESDLKRLVSALDPGCVVPMHTFHPGEYQNLFGNVVQLDDGEEFSVPVDSRKRRK